MLKETCVGQPINFSPLSKWSTLLSCIKAKVLGRNLGPWHWRSDFWLNPINMGPQDTSPTYSTPTEAQSWVASEGMLKGSEVGGYKGTSQRREPQVMVHKTSPLPHPNTPYRPSHGPIPGLRAILNTNRSNHGCLSRHLMLRFCWPCHRCFLNSCLLPGT